MSDLIQILAGQLVDEHGEPVGGCSPVVIDAKDARQIVEHLTARKVVRPDGAIDALTNGQRQLDMDGCEVGVSRQALDETLAYLALLETRAVETVSAKEGRKP